MGYQLRLCTKTFFLSISLFLLIMSPCEASREFSFSPYHLELASTYINMEASILAGPPDSIYFSHIDYRLLPVEACFQTFPGLYVGGSLWTNYPERSRLLGKIVYIVAYDCGYGEAIPLGEEETREGYFVGTKILVQIAGCAWNGNKHADFLDASLGVRWGPGNFGFSFSLGYYFVDASGLTDFDPYHGSHWYASVGFNLGGLVN